MTKRERAQVVELLRCAADQGSLSAADVYLASSGPYLMVWDAKRAVQESHRGITPHDGEIYRWLLLEAALRVEEGSWP